MPGRVTLYIQMKTTAVGTRKRIPTAVDLIAFRQLSKAKQTTTRLTGGLDLDWTRVYFALTIQLPRRFYFSVSSRRNIQFTRLSLSAAQARYSSPELVAMR